MKLAVQLVIWNGEKYLAKLFDSLKEQTFKDWELLVWDNGSEDSSRELIDMYVGSLGCAVKKHFHESNVGFAPAHNGLFNLSNSEYIFTLNQDTVLEKDVFEKIVQYLNHNDKVASVAPAILRISDQQHIKIVDSLGLEFKKTRQVVDIDAGKDFDVSTPSTTNSRQVFGVTAAAAAYSRSAIQKVCRAKEMFDNNYISYQEDVDLAWKLRLGGYDAAVLTDAIVYHNRSIREQDGGYLKNALHKKDQPLFVRKQSYINHLATIIKNEQWQNFILDFIFIFWYEGMKIIYNLIFDREVLLAMRELWQRRYELIEERSRIKSITIESWRNIGRWFF